MDNNFMNLFLHNTIQNIIKDSQKIYGKTMHKYKEIFHLQNLKTSQYGGYTLNYTKPKKTIIFLFSTELFFTGF